MTKAREMHKAATLNDNVLGAPNTLGVESIALNSWRLLGDPNRRQTLRGVQMKGRLT